MDVHGLTHLENILYREDKLEERTRLLFKWVIEKELSQTEFDKLVGQCNVECIERDKRRRYGQQEFISDASWLLSCTKSRESVMDARLDNLSEQYNLDDAYKRAWKQGFCGALLHIQEKKM